MFFVPGTGVGAGDLSGSGGGYGGRGGVAANGGKTGSPHGSILYPKEFGSGGGGTHGGRGGGILELQIKATLEVDGKIIPWTNFKLD